MYYYEYNIDGYYIGKREAQKDPLETQRAQQITGDPEFIVYTMPGRYETTEEPPVPADPNKIARWDIGAASWEIVDKPIDKYDMIINKLDQILQRLDNERVG